jgi:hypothetical protein
VVPRATLRSFTVLALNHQTVVLSTVVLYANCRRCRDGNDRSDAQAGARDTGTLLGRRRASGRHLGGVSEQARGRCREAAIAARAACARRRYVELMRSCGYPVPGESEATSTDEAVSTALFADLTPDERDELLEYLAWYRARRRSNHDADGSNGRA